MFFSSKLNKFENLKHCFFSRKNGVSKGYYESLNFASNIPNKSKQMFLCKSLFVNKERCFSLTIPGNLSELFEKNRLLKHSRKYETKRKALVMRTKNITESLWTFRKKSRENLKAAKAGWRLWLVVCIGRSALTTDAFSLLSLPATASISLKKTLICSIGEQNVNQDNQNKEK